jgi:SAM-dependent methyltransferase
VAERRDAEWDRQRLSFGCFAGTYDASRPEWPAGTARWLIGADPGGPLAERAGRDGLRVADVGAGTGKLTRTLAGLGHEVVAVDPSAGMLEALRAAVPGTPTFIGTAEQLPLPDGSVDAVTFAQAWHWVEPDAALRDVARVLRPGGVLGIAWHVRDESVPWVGELSRTADRPHDLSSDGDSDDGLPGPPLFTPLERAVFGYDHRVTVEQLVTLASSWSYVATREDDERERILAAVRALGERVLAAAGEIVIPHRTHCFRVAKAAA